jgi:catechol 2,3-dioxygenase-like lactoylglutathione lyase family enzyme
MTIFPNDERNRSMFHSGLVVPDINATAETYSELFGLRWAPLRRSSLSVRVDGVIRQVELVATYSIQGPPYLELIQEYSGDVWSTDALGLNHIGFWAEDLPSAVRALERSGLPARVYDEDADTSLRRFSYHAAATGVWLELVAPSFAPKLVEWLADPE